MGYVQVYAFRGLQKYKRDKVGDEVNSLKLQKAQNQRMLQEKFMSLHLLDQDHFEICTFHHKSHY